MKPDPSEFTQPAARPRPQLRARIENEIHFAVATMTNQPAANRSPDRTKRDRTKKDRTKKDRTKKDRTKTNQLKNKIQQRQARVGIIGLGYVGLPLALLFSDQKFTVTGFDIDPRQVETLAQGGSYIYRITTEEIQKAKAQGFSASSDYARLVEMDAVIICVP